MTPKDERLKRGHESQKSEDPPYREKPIDALRDIVVDRGVLNWKTLVPLAIGLFSTYQMSLTPRGSMNGWTWTTLAASVYCLGSMFVRTALLRNKVQAAINHGEIPELHGNRKE